VQAYLVIFATAVAAFWGAPSFVVISGIVALLAALLSDQRNIFANPAVAGSGRNLAMTVGFAVIACGSAYGLGALVGGI
jgi:hypothetical protein